MFTLQRKIESSGDGWLQKIYVSDYTAPATTDRIFLVQKITDPFNSTDFADFARVCRVADIFNYNTQNAYTSYYRTAYLQSYHETILSTDTFWDALNNSITDLKDSWTALNGAASASESFSLSDGSTLDKTVYEAPNAFKTAWTTSDSKPVFVIKTDGDDTFFLSIASETDRILNAEGNLDPSLSIETQIDPIYFTNSADVNTFKDFLITDINNYITNYNNTYPLTFSEQTI